MCTNLLFYKEDKYSYKMNKFKESNIQQGENTALYT